MTNKTLKVPYNNDRVNRIYCYLLFSDLPGCTDGRGQTSAKLNNE